MKHLASSLLVLILVLSGCSLLVPDGNQYQNPPKTPGSLEFIDAPRYNGTAEPAEHLRNNGTYHLSLEIEVYGNFGRSEGSKQVFHRVIVIGYSKEGKKVCSHKVGNISRGDDPEVVLSCPSPPWLITMVADESPCKRHIEIKYLIYTESTEESVEEEYRWHQKTRKCGQNLPPAKISNPH